ncbi:hypothetical protein BH23ACT9_BH23ACT9_29230 [soil metagenome]
MSRTHSLASPGRMITATLLVLLLAAAMFAAQRPAPANASGLLDHVVATASGEILAIVHPAEGVALADAIAGADALGISPAGQFPNVGVFGAIGSARAFDRLAATGLISRVERNAPLQLFTNTSHTATRGAEVLDGEVTLPDGTIIDGSGVGVAVVDSGHDGTHPALSGPTNGNVKVVFPTNATVPFADTDTISAGGHGTHVSGIVVGNGTTYSGAAPGASLYGVSAGTLISVHSALAGLEWVLANHDRVDPPIRVVNNSWGSGPSNYNPNDAVSRAVKNLIGQGVTVVFAGGNSGGNGSVQQTSPTCVDPTPGVICVASYDDRNNGTREGNVSSFSSRGRNGQLNTYPDISAPGSNIISTCRATLPICATGSMNEFNTYYTLSGTSMAAPHIAGIAAQLYQIDPSLTPADVERVLVQTALKFENGAPYELDPSTSLTTSVDKGAGLVDVRAAVESLLGD